MLKIRPPDRPNNQQNKHNDVIAYQILIWITENLAAVCQKTGQWAYWQLLYLTCASGCCLLRHLRDGLKVEAAQKAHKLSYLGDFAQVIVIFTSTR